MRPLRWMVLCVICAPSAVSPALAAPSTTIASVGAHSFSSVDRLVRDHTWRADGRREDAEFGYSVAGAGDVNGDGYADVIVGAPHYEDQYLVEGRAYVYQGSAQGLSAAPDWVVQGGEDWGWFGGSVGSAGDVNGDGYDDVVVGAPDTYASEAGQAYVYHGSAAGLSDTPDWIGMADQEGDQFGASVGTAGDVNADGYDDVIVGSPWYGECDPLCDEGRVFVYEGSAAGLPTTPTWIADGDQSVELFGASVGTAGDVNGDGYDDVIAGAPYYSNGETQEGRVLVYQGSAAGLSTSPDWLVEGDQFLVQLGASVGTAGDVNADGYDDVIAGGSYSGGVTGGEALVYLGSAVGLSTIASWKAEANGGVSSLGHSVATAGDVDGDGYSDVVVGAYGAEHGETAEGRAYFFRGGAAGGVSRTPDWRTEGDQEYAFLGYSVATAGDVNGDGYAELIIGARLYDHPLTNEGAVFVYPGSPGP